MGTPERHVGSGYEHGVIESAWTPGQVVGGTSDIQTYCMESSLRPEVNSRIPSHVPAMAAFCAMTRANLVLRVVEMNRWASASAPTRHQDVTSLGAEVRRRGHR